MSFKGVLHEGAISESGNVVEGYPLYKHTRHKLEALNAVIKLKGECPAVMPEGRAKRKEDDLLIEEMVKKEKIFL